MHGDSSFMELASYGVQRRPEGSLNTALVYRVSGFCIKSNSARADSLDSHTWQIAGHPRRNLRMRRLRSRGVRLERNQAGKSAGVIARIGDAVALNAPGEHRRTLR